MKWIKRYTLLFVCGLLSAALAGAANGTQVQSRNEQGYKIDVYTALDGEGDVLAEGVAIRVSGWHSLTIWPDPDTIDAGDTWEAECAVSATNVEPVSTAWVIVQVETASTAAKRLEPGDACEWLRINKPTDTDDASTVLVLVVKHNG